MTPLQHPPLQQPMDTELSSESILGDRRAWPRRGLDEERAAEFMGLYAEHGQDALPPIEVVALEDGQFIVADGWHRLTAQLRLELDHVRAVVVAPRPGLSASEVAYERALETASRTAKPLSRAEKRAAIARLLAERPAASDREIARLVGVDHKTVGSVRRRVGSSPAEPSDESDQSAGERYLAALSADEIVLRLVRDTDRLWQARGLGEIALGDHVGRRLAHALAERHGERAQEWAQRIHEWGAVALAELDRETGA